MNAIVPTLYTLELEDSIKFYCDTLGFTCNGYDKEYGWATISKGGVEIMLTLPNKHIPFTEPLFTGSLYIKMDNIESFWGSVQDKVNVSYPLESFDYGMKEFGMYDNNGYLIQFGQEI